MNTTPLTRIACLEKMLAAEQERETLILRVRELDTHLSKLRQVLPAKASPHPPRTPRTLNPNRRPHGELRKKIMNVLEAAGGKGVHAKAIASKIDVDSRLVHAWLSVYVKRIPGLTRVGPGYYTFSKS